MITITAYTQSPPSITFAIGPTRWEYTLPPGRALDDILYIRKRGGAGKALAAAKRKAIASMRLNKRNEA